MTAAGFKRMWETPRRASGGGLLDPITPRQRYVRMQSLIRYRRRPDAYQAGEEPKFDGQLGHVDSFRFITSTPRPDPEDVITSALLERIAASLRQPDPRPVLVITTPDGYRDHMRAWYQEAHDNYPIILGMDFASGPDWSAIHAWGRPDLFERYNRLPPARSLQDQERLAAAELKRARRRIKLRQLAAKGAIGKADQVQ